MRQIQWADLPKFFPGFSDPERWITQLQAHWALVGEWNQRAALTAVPADEAVFRNYAESLEIWSRLCQGRTPRSAGDIGSGAGFPGLVGAVVSPETTVHLIESQRRKGAFLEVCKAALHLENVTVHPERAEDLGRTALRGTLSGVVARAVAPLPVLLEYAAPLMAANGIAVFPKGSATLAEVAGSAGAARQLGLSLTRIADLRPEVSAIPFAAIYTKTGTTPKRFPRKAASMAQHPLR